jgi:hypothetical protein
VSVPKPTLTESVRELERSVVNLEFQAKGIDRLTEANQRISEELTQLKVVFAQELAQLKVGFGQESAQLSDLPHEKWTRS